MKNVKSSPRQPDLEFISRSAYQRKNLHEAVEYWQQALVLFSEERRCKALLDVIAQTQQEN